MLDRQSRCPETSVLVFLPRFGISSTHILNIFETIHFRISYLFFNFQHSMNLPPIISMVVRIAYVCTIYIK